MTIASPTRSVPDWMRTVAVAPAALVEVGLDRDTTGVHGRVGPQVERGVRRSAGRSEQLLDVRAPLGRRRRRTSSPPYSSADQAVLGELLTDLGRVSPSTSILLTATTIGTSAACAWLSASMVCGMTPSSAATTRIAMSVTLAPRARMAVKAS